MTVLDHYAVHPVADWFPLMEGDEYRQLVESIRENGQREPIIVDPDGRLLDGRNRVRACLEIDVDPQKRIFDGDPVQLILDLNLHRRHLTDGQRAMIAARIAAQHQGQYQQNPDNRFLPPTQREAADLLNVGINQVQSARRVVKSGTPDLVALTDAGKTPVTTAARVAMTCDRDEQDEFVRNVNNGMNPTVAAPPDPKVQKRKAAAQQSQESDTPPRASRRKNSQHAALIESVNNTLRVWSEHTLPQIDVLDDSVTSEKAAALHSDLSKAIRNLNRIRKLLKERTA